MGGGSWKKAWRWRRPQGESTRWRHSRDPPSTAASGANHQVRPQDVWVLGPSPPVHKFIQPPLLICSAVCTLWMPHRRAHWYSGQDRLRESSDLHAKKEREGESAASDIAILPNGRRNVMESNGRRKPIRLRPKRKEIGDRP